jgi:hypothetical protein
MTLITALIDGKRISIADEWIIKALEPVSAELEMVRRAPKRIGIRNESGEIYRVVGAAGMDQFLDTFVLLSNLFLDVQIPVGVHPSKQDYDAVFNLISPMKWEACLKRGAARNTTAS